jgi:hypothetical protein
VDEGGDRGVNVYIESVCCVQYHLSQYLASTNKGRYSIPILKSEIAPRTRNGDTRYGNLTPPSTSAYKNIPHSTSIPNNHRPSPLPPHNTQHTTRLISPRSAIRHHRGYLGGYSAPPSAGVVSRQQRGVRRVMEAGGG